MTKRRKRKIDPKKSASRLPAKLQAIAFTKADNRAFHKRQSFGAASEVRTIDPRKWSPSA